jgi:hypothetical protein
MQRNYTIGKSFTINENLINSLAINENADLKAKALPSSGLQTHQPSSIDRLAII